MEPNVEHRPERSCFEATLDGDPDTASLRV
jgi:hypothetical protein